MVKLKQVSSDIISILYQLLYDTHTILKNNNIKYYITGGSLLGAVRHNGIIPWDDDIDICVNHSDLRKIMGLRDIFGKCGYGISKIWLGLKIFLKNRPRIPGKTYSFPFIDVFPVSKVNGKYVLSYKTLREMWPKEVYHEKELFPLDLYTCGSYTVYGPKEPLGYLDRMYGKDWNKIAYRQYDHSKEEEVEKIKVKLTPEMRKPARPTKVTPQTCTKPCIRKSIKKIPPLLRKPTKTCQRPGKCYNNFNQKMGVYVINCEIHKDRLKKFTKYAHRAKLRACRIPCILGKKFTNELICELTKRGLLHKNAEMTPIEVSINMSHYNVWQRLLNSCYDYALIMEDDVEVHGDFIEKINNILEEVLEEASDFSILHLWNGNWAKTIRHQKKILDVSPKITIMQERKPYNAGAVAYIISKEYAQYLVDNSFPITIPQDILMGNFPKVGKHLTVRMTYDRDQECYVSPVLDNPCGGEEGTGASTRTSTMPTIQETSCKKCP